MKKTRVSTLGLIALLVLAGVLFAVGFAFPGVRTSSETFFSLLTAPRELKDALFVVGPEDGAAVARIGFGRIVTTTYPGKSVVAVSRGGGVTAALMRSVADGSVDAYRLSGNGVEALTTDGLEKKDIAVSPDGTAVAFSYQGSAKEGVPEDVYDVRRFEIGVLDLESGDMARYPGTHPAFLDDGALLYFAPDGVTVRDLASGNASRIFDPLVFRTVVAPAVSKSGMFAVQNPHTPQYDVFKVASRSPVVLEYLRSIPAETGYTAAFRDDDLYIVSLSDERVVFRKQGTSGGETGTAVLSLSADGFLPIMLAF